MTVEQDQAAEIARLREALAARTEQLTETLAALTVLRARHERLAAEADMLAAVARAAVPVVTLPLTDEAIGELFDSLKAYGRWSDTHAAPEPEVVAVEVPAIPLRDGKATRRKRTSVANPIVA